MRAAAHAQNVRLRRQRRRQAVPAGTGGRGRVAGSSAPWWSGGRAAARVQPGGGSEHPSAPRGLWGSAWASPGVRPSPWLNPAPPGILVAPGYPHPPSRARRHPRGGLGCPQASPHSTPWHPNIHLRPQHRAPAPTGGTDPRKCWLRAATPHHGSSPSPSSPG